jgi:hypothetical protein
MQEVDALVTHKKNHSTEIQAVAVQPQLNYVYYTELHVLTYLRLFSVHNWYSKHIEQEIYTLCKSIELD